MKILRVAMLILLILILNSHQILAQNQTKSTSAIYLSKYVTDETLINLFNKLRSALSQDFTQEQIDLIIEMIFRYYVINENLPKLDNVIIKIQVVNNITQTFEEKKKIRISWWYNDIEVYFVEIDVDVIIEINNSQNNNLQSIQNSNEDYSGQIFVPLYTPLVYMIPVLGYPYVVGGALIVGWSNIISIVGIGIGLVGSYKWAIISPFLIINEILMIGGGWGYSFIDKKIQFVISIGVKLYE